MLWRNPPKKTFRKRVFRFIYGFLHLQFRKVRSKYVSGNIKNRFKWFGTKILLYFEALTAHDDSCQRLCFSETYTGSVCHWFWETWTCIRKRKLEVCVGYTWHMLFHFYLHMSSFNYNSLDLATLLTLLDIPTTATLIVVLEFFF